MDVGLTVGWEDVKRSMYTKANGIDREIDTDTRADIP